MDLEETFDLSDEFKQAKLQLHPDELKSTNLSEASTATSPMLSARSPEDSWTDKKIEVDAGSIKKGGLLSPIVSIPQRISESFKSRRGAANNNETSLQPAALLLTGGQASDFFTFRQGIVQQAVTECIENVIDAVADGHVEFYFLLTEISLWDTDKERLVLLTNKCIIVVKYDFIAMKRLDFKKLPLKVIDTLIIGDLVYPTGSIVPHLNGFVDGLSNIVQTCVTDVWSKNKTEPDFSNYFHPRNRNMRGIRLMWNDGKPLNFITRWNPLNDNVEMTTFTSHPLLFHRDCVDEDHKKLYNIEDFSDAICRTAATLNLPPTQCVIERHDITLDNYVGIGSLIHNRNALGYFKVRGRFSF